MHSALKTVVFGLAIVCLSSGLGLAQSVEDRASALKVWRGQCADPDPDLRLAYLEAALAESDASIQRICVREALESDNADVRNLGLRAAVASMDKIVFETTIPPELQAAYERAGNDDRKLKEVNNYYVVQTFRAVQNGLVFKIDAASLDTNRSVWYPLATLRSADDRYKGDALIVGSKLTWQGGLHADSTWTCVLAAELVPGARLQGSLKCEKQWAIPVSAPLL